MQINTLFPLHLTARLYGILQCVIQNNTYIISIYFLFWRKYKINIKLNLLFLCFLTFLMNDNIRNRIACLINEIQPANRFFHFPDVAFQFFTVCTDYSFYIQWNIWQMASHIMPKSPHISIDILYFCNFLLHLLYLIFQHNALSGFFIVLYKFLKQHYIGYNRRKQQKTDYGNPNLCCRNCFINNHSHPIFNSHYHHFYCDWNTQCRNAW